MRAPIWTLEIAALSHEPLKYPPYLHEGNSKGNAVKL